MRGGFGLVSVVFVCGVVVVPASSAEARARKSRSQQPNGEISVDVTVRTRPRLSAPGLTDLRAGTPVRSSRAAKARGWTRITEPMPGWIPSETFARLDTEPAASSAARGPSLQEGGAPGPAPAAETTRSEPASSAGETRSESDLMLDALRATRGESPNAARIARVVRDTAIEAKRKRLASPLPTFWKDPFVDDSDPPAPVLSRRWRVAGRQSARLAEAADSRARQAELLAARRETARARADAAAARAEAAAIRADAAREKAELARLEATAAHADALAARHDAEAARAGCSERPLSRRALLGRGLGGGDVAVRAASRSERRRKMPRGQQALNRAASRRAPGTSPGNPARAAAGLAAPPATPVDEPSVAPPAVAPQPANASYRGILVVPIR